MDLVVISLEPWDQVRRRNQHLVDGLLDLHPGLRVLFVEPAHDPIHAARRRSRPRPGPGLRRARPTDSQHWQRLWLLGPTKWLPRRIDPSWDRRWAAQVVRAADRLGFSAPLLWVNDPAGAAVLSRTSWPALYDITDDWLAARRPSREIARLAAHEHILLTEAAEVVVCSPGLRRVKGQGRRVELVPNAADLSAYAAGLPRPGDLPAGPVALYAGTLHTDRLDVGLVRATAAELVGAATVVLLGPDALDPASRASLADAGVVILGARAASEVPAYLLHADVLLVPHVVDEFTDSLDPIKRYEYEAAGRPVVSTAVAGFVDSPAATIADRAAFPAAVRRAVEEHKTPRPAHRPTGVDWADRVRQVRALLERVGQAQAAG
ncbi:glycosyltransferase [Flexivirga sp. ID2601S]|uniref:Glycosyltransferase n=1 Tax=Flexivirga aerilata TaxID=1656889 RepID=A0A849AI57_9MICO|nr:glycosyltransferase [Flexivirga aerilata]NNG40079.1 glycosyltransferase [Flexivirga aerilata]